MPLRLKMLLVSAVFLFVLVACFYTVQRLVVLDSFLALEEGQARRDLKRCQEALNREIQSLGRVCEDWAAWDDTCQFVQDTNEAYAKSNLVVSTFDDLALDLLLIYRQNGEKVWGRLKGRPGVRGLPFREYVEFSLPAGHPLRTPPRTGSRVAGLTNIPQGLLLAASYPIITSDKKGPVQGAVIMGRILTREYVEKLSTQTKVDFHLWPFNKGMLPEQERPILSRLQSQKLLPILEPRGDLLAAYTSIAGLAQKPAALLRASLPRDIRQKGIEANTIALLFLSGAGALILILLMLLLRGMVLNPLAGLIGHTTAIRQSKDLSLRLNSRRGDELGVLSREFDSMIEQMARDSRERRKAEAALADREEQLRVITDHLPVLIAHLSSDLHYLFSNKFHEYCLGLTPWEIRGKHLGEVLGPDNYAALAGHIKNALAGNTVNFEGQLTFLHGQSHQIIANLVPHLDEQGQVKGLFLLVVDQSDRKKAEDERVFREKLQTAVETAGAVCHELNQPLQTILATAELILMQHPSQHPNQKELDVFISESQRIAGITRRLQKITDYKTKTYVGDKKILDIDESSRN